MSELTERQCGTLSILARTIQQGNSKVEWRVLQGGRYQLQYRTVNKYLATMWHTLLWTRNLRTFAQRKQAVDSYLRAAIAVQDVLNAGKS